MVAQHRRKVQANIRDVAAAAGVSTTAVSRWLNGAIKLPEGTANRIRKAIAELRYEPNLHARRLNSGSTDTLALVLPDIADPFFAALAGSVEAAADDAGYGLMLCSTRNRTEREVDYLERARRNHVDGVLFATNHPDDDGRLLAAMNGQRAVVLLDEDVPGVTASRVFCDNAGGGRMATQALIDAGHRRIAFLGGMQGVMSAEARAEGYRAALHANGLAYDERLVAFGAYTAEHGAKSMRALLALEERPTAIFASSDQIAIGALAALAEAALAVPLDLSIIAYDDVAPFSHFLPAITAVRQPLDDMGRGGVAAMVRLLSDPASDTSSVFLPVQLIRRGSVATPSASPFSKRRHGTRSLA
jgi:LacI family transcriptional regulator